MLPNGSFVRIAVIGHLSFGAVAANDSFEPRADIGLLTYHASAANGRFEPNLLKLCKAANGCYLDEGKNFQQLLWF